MSCWIYLIYGRRNMLDSTKAYTYPGKKHLIRGIGNGVYENIQLNREGRSKEEDWFAPKTIGTAVELLTRNYNRKDFFLWIDLFDPHEPWDPPRWLSDLCDPGYKGEVYDWATGWQYASMAWISDGKRTYTSWLDTGAATHAFHLFDLKTDPLQKSNLVRKDGALASRMHAALKKKLRDMEMDP